MHSISRTIDFDRFEIKYLGVVDAEFAIKFYAPKNKYVSDLNIYCTSTELVNLRRDILRAIDESRKIQDQWAAQ